MNKCQLKLWLLGFRLRGKRDLNAMIHLCFCMEQLVLKQGQMEEIEVKPIGCETAETAFAGGDGPAARGVTRQNLAYQENFPPAASDCLAHQFLGAAVSVHFCRIDEPQTGGPGRSATRQLPGRGAAVPPCAKCLDRGREPRHRIAAWLYERAKPSRGRGALQNV